MRAASSRSFEVVRKRSDVDLFFCVVECPQFLGASPLGPASVPSISLRRRGCHDPRVEGVETRDVWVERLRAALRDGREVDVTSGGVTGSVRLGSGQDGAGRAMVPAGAVREVLLHPPEDADPRGLIVVGARIAGRLDLEYAQVGIPVTFRRCHFPDGICAEGCSLVQLTLSDCAIAHLDLDQSHVRLDVSLTGTEVAAQVRIVRAHIGGQLDMTAATVTNDFGPTASPPTGAYDWTAPLSPPRPASPRKVTSRALRAERRELTVRPRAQCDLSVPPSTGTWSWTSASSTQRPTPSVVSCGLLKISPTPTRPPAQRAFPCTHGTGWGCYAGARPGTGHSPTDTSRRDQGRRSRRGNTHRPGHSA